jgi:periplasmic divalent cation tolerance protein
MTPLLVLMTASSRDEARTIARVLVEEELAACCNLLGEIDSIYRWKGTVEEAQEVLVLIKTTSSRFDALQQRVVELHSYDVPELIALPIVEGLPEYLEWLRGSVGEGD